MAHADATTKPTNNWFLQIIFNIFAWSPSTYRARLSLSRCDDVLCTKPGEFFDRHTAHPGGKTNENFYIGGFASRCDTWNAGSVSMRLKIFLTCTSKWSLVFCILFSLSLMGESTCWKYTLEKKSQIDLNALHFIPALYFLSQNQAPKVESARKLYLIILS